MSVRVSGILATALCGALLAPALAAQSNYVAFELPRENNFDPLFTQDMDGDGRLDIVVPFYDAVAGRELHIHRQLDNGSFATQPRRIEIKTEIIAVGFADLRPEPGVELVLLAHNGVFSLSTAVEGYVGNLRPLVEWELIAAMPNLERLQFIGSLPDVNKDGHADLLLPGADTYSLFYGQGETFVAAAEVSTVNPALTDLQRRSRGDGLDATLGINAEEGVVIRVQTESGGPYRGFVQSWQESAEPQSLFDSEAWMPSLHLAALDDDDRDDLVYINVGEDGYGQLNIHRQQANGQFAATPDWFGSIDIEGELRLTDLNGDGQDDLLRLAGDGSEWEARFYLNRSGSFDLASPQQLMRFSGYDVRLEIIESAGRPVLSVSYYTIPVVDAIRSASINRVQLLYGSDAVEAGQVFNRRPSSRLEESFSAENVRGLSEQMSLRFDVDGDGRNDALYITENGTLAAKRVSDDLRIAEDPFWEYISPRTVFEFEVMTLNDDDLPDLLLRHGTVTTFLVATP